MTKALKIRSVISCGDTDNLGLKIGERANLELATKERLWGEIVGAKPGFFLSVWVPELREKDYKSFLKDYPEITVRAKCDSCFLCGFTCSVTRVQLYPYPILFLSYPKEFEKVNLRKSRRGPCFQIVSLIDGDTEFCGVFRDISEGGGRVEFTFPKDVDTSRFAENEKIKYRFDYDHSECTISGVGTIKNMILSGNRLSLGLRFDSFDGNCKNELGKVIEAFDI